MAVRKKAGPIDGAKMLEIVPSEEKIARLLALLVIKDLEDKEEAAITLLSAGFQAGEIAALLRVGKNYANVAAHRRRKGNNQTKSKR